MISPFEVKVDSTNVHLFNETLISNTIHNDSNSSDSSIDLLAVVAIWLVLLMTIFFGATGNILVLYVYTNRQDNKTCTFFIKMLAIVDLAICLILAPLELYQLAAGIKNEILCKFYGFLSTHVLYSTFLITIIAFDRYFCICWPLYKIITVHRARAIVIICGILSSLLAIIPMAEFSTFEHLFSIHQNDSEALSIKIVNDTLIDSYKHVEHIKASGLFRKITVGPAISVTCSHTSSVEIKFEKFIKFYRKFHGSLYAICICLVLILYAFIYNAVYQRRVTRTRKLSAYRRIIRSYLMNNETQREDASSSKGRHFHRTRRRQRPTPSTLTLLCCYFCRNSEDYQQNSHRPSESAFHEPLNEDQQKGYRRHLNDESSSTMIHSGHPRPKVILEVNGGCGKRYSAISMTSMTYLTSGVWDDSTSTHSMRSRINSIAATTYCGTEHSSTSRPSTSTEDSFEQATKSLNVSSTLSPLRSMTPPSSSHLMVPGLQMTPPSAISSENSTKDDRIEESNLPRSVSQCANFLHPSIVRKPSNTLSTRQAQRSSDASVHHRKVSFLTSTGVVEQCISEDPPNISSPTTASPPRSPNIIQQRSQFTLLTENQRSLSTVSSLDHRNSSIRTLSISSARRPSAFDGETQRILERQQTQERLANIRTTFTLFIVTATFLIMYLPSIIQTLFNIQQHKFREVLFLLCYVNSACNPLIYSFFNVNFRNDIRRIYECQKREYLARQY